jgi:hypothetical protein
VTLTESRQQVSRQRSLLVGLRCHCPQLWLFGIGLALAIGCQKSPYQTVPVRGTVTIDGQPFANGKVMFAPVAGADNLNPGKPAFGQLQDDGSFVLSTYGTNDGAVVGEHSVTIINIDPPASDGGPIKATPTSAKRLPKFKRVPAGKLQVVAGQDNSFDIKLSRQDVTRFAAGK